ncbi:S-adenosyl-L-methionine-dependent methyltransferase [Glomus cerebriforme]|uniref:S-adenosyl-L-methionine-dependent methyltransferase n=1 Tax=Glomus cerebriforme TaxID=658196 RepID=A0A397SJS5_9GLOM|nr:S-adenosyl-L-methionine-dependent methyltransferase [Glomus cerebriforme]
MCKQLKPEKIYKPHDFNKLPLPNFDIFHYKRNRRYTNVSGVNHLFPVDNDENDRLQHQHGICYHVWGNHFSAPIEELLKKDGTKVLDVGCGPAMWTLEIASLYPKARFTGVDIVPTYPIQTKPRNVEFLQANIVKYGIPYEDNTFDYVFCRLMNFSFTIKDWKNVINEICRVCKVGGYIEFMEKDVDLNVKESKKALSRFVKNLRRKNIEPIITPKIKQYIKETVNADINHEKKDVPIGKWGGKIGEYNKEIIKWGADNLKIIMVEECDYDEKEWDLLLDSFMKELDHGKILDNIHRIWAKKETEIRINDIEICECKPNFPQLQSFLPTDISIKFQKFKNFIKNVHLITTY